MLYGNLCVRTCVRSSSSSEGYACLGFLQGVRRGVGFLGGRYREDKMETSTSYFLVSQTELESKTRSRI